MFWTVATLLFVLAAAPAWAQNRFGTTVQLPTIQLTTIDTSVMVPDRGYTNLGGIGRKAAGATRYGPALPPFASRGIGSSTSASRFGLSATIIDLAELDAEVLSMAASAGASSAGAASPKSVAAQPAGDDFSRRAEAAQEQERAARSRSNETSRVQAEETVRGRDDDSPGEATSRPEVPPDRLSVAEIRRRRQRAASEATEEGLRLMREGDEAAAEGNTTLARAQYRLAAGKLSGAPRQEAIEKLRALVVKRRTSEPR